MSLHIEMTPIQRKILLDRYARKDVTRKSPFTVGQTVITTDEPREIGTITYIEDYGSGNVIVTLDDGTARTVHPDFLDIPLETTARQVIERVAKGIASVERTPELQKKWEKEFIALMENWAFVPAGRILASAGTESGASYYNCFVIPSPHDSRGGLFRTAELMCEIMSHGGGVGFNISSLRPHRAPVYGVNGRSSGAVSWMELYSLVTKSTQQDGSRRGALMLILDDWHPDILDFVNIKRDPRNVTNANISVNISDKFMDAVKNDDVWNLIFPDTRHPTYDGTSNGDISTWLEEGKPTKIWKTLPARELWNAIIESAWACAEPGLFFGERYNTMSNSWYYAPIRACNPCGEEGLPDFGVCNLGAINLAEFYDAQTNSVDWVKLEMWVKKAIRFLDNVIEATPHFDQRIREQQYLERRIGLNTMGLAELLIKCGIRYGSEKSLKKIDDIYEVITTAAYKASIELAKERGAFPACDRDHLLDSGFIKTLPTYIRDGIYNFGLRNVTLLTQAPNGTIGTMVGTSTGMEPFFALEWERTSRLGTHTERVKIYDEWRQSHPNDAIPDYFVTAMDLTPEEHVRVEAAIQRWIDASISKTCNVPNDYTVEQTRALYELMYELGCKGGTIYRDGSRETQVLRATTKAETPEVAPEPESNFLLKPIPSVRYGKTYTVKTHLGTLHITLNFDNAYNLLDVFLNIGKAGSDLQADAEAVGRLVSTILRINSPLTDAQRISVLIDQLEHIGGSSSMGFGPSKISSMADAVATVLREDNKTFTREEVTEEAEWDGVGYSVGKKKTFGDICPQCHSATFVRSEGCRTCISCGHSLC